VRGGSRNERGAFFYGVHEEKEFVSARYRTKCIRSWIARNRREGCQGAKRNGRRAPGSKQGDVKIGSRGER